MDFKEFPKISRLSRDIVITEKLDGTNAQVFIQEIPKGGGMLENAPIIETVGNLALYAGSRTKWITPEDDNYGFARWVKENAGQLAELGVGAHFGEWWGQGIQRRYNAPKKAWSLFNVHKWAEVRPACCDVVPLLYRGMMDTGIIEHCLDTLRLEGSKASPGFMNPEGVVIFHTASGHLYKKTIEKDEEYKSKSNPG